jgi:hypothetical protein
MFNLLKEIAMKESIEELAGIWHTYLNKVHEDKSERAYELIYNVLPAELGTITPKDSNLLVGSSGGTGRITAGPWFATFDKRVTTKPTEGLYVVFLFSVDMSRLVLQLGLATTQFTNFHGSGQKGLDFINSASGAVRKSLTGLLSSNRFNRIKSRLSYKPSDLKTSKSNKLQIAYEQASVLNISYEIKNLNNKTLVEDYIDILSLYTKAIDVDVIPSIDTLLCQTIDSSNAPGTNISSLKVTEFEPRIKKTQLNSNPSRINFRTKLGVKANTKAIGDIGEQVVLKFEKEKLINAGRADLADRVVHEEAENNYPGWDITSFNIDGSPIQIEVKATTSTSINSPILTANEWSAAIIKGDSYYIYLVTGVKKGKADKIEILQNPHRLSTSKDISLEVHSYQLKLY